MQGGVVRAGLCRLLDLELFRTRYAKIGQRHQQREQDRRGQGKLYRRGAVLAAGQSGEPTQRGDRLFAEFTRRSRSPSYLAILPHHGPFRSATDIP